MMTEMNSHPPPGDTPRMDSPCVGEPARAANERCPQPEPEPERRGEGCAGESASAGASDGASADVAALVELARSGDRAAFDTLVALHQRPMEIYLAGLIGDGEQARDLTQDVFWHAWNRLFELREPERFRAWLFRAATNRARSWLRRRRIVSWVSLERLHGPKEDATPGQYPGRYQSPAREAGLAAAESGFEERLAETDTLSRALRRVPLDYRTCLLLHVSLGFSVREVAEQLGTTPGAVRMRLHRGLAALREAYRTENA